MFAGSRSRHYGWDCLRRRSQDLGNDTRLVFETVLKREGGTEGLEKSPCLMLE